MDINSKQQIIHLDDGAVDIEVVQRVITLDVASNGTEGILEVSVRPQTVTIEGGPEISADLHQHTQQLYLKVDRSVGVVNAGPLGPRGIQGETGDTGPRGLKGDQGDQGDKGDQGDRGETGPGADAYYEQSWGMPVTTITVPHNLNKYPSIVVKDTSGRDVRAGIQHQDKNNVILTFENPFAGSLSAN